MARQARLAVAGQPHLLVLRGNNRQAVFVQDRDRELFLDLLAAAALREQVQVHAWVLLESEVRLLLTPPQPEALSRLMQSLGRSYVRRFNLWHGRSGTLWEGRYRSTVLEPERYLLPCMVDMDWLPVRTGLVNAPDGYPWSTHLHYIGRRHDAWLSTPAKVWALGNTPFAREAAYAERVQQGLEAGLRRVLEQADRGWVLGSPSFLEALGQQTARRLVKGRPGRPRGAAPPTSA
jgi:putative transposase